MKREAVKPLYWTQHNSMVRFDAGTNHGEWLAALYIPVPVALLLLGHWARTARSCINPQLASDSNTVLLTTKDAVLKIFYLAICNIGHNRGGELGTATQGWKQSLNAFAITFPDCINLTHD